MGAALFGVLAVLNWISPDNIRLSWEAPASIRACCSCS
jgi:hypothetical protein